MEIVYLKSQSRPIEIARQPKWAFDPKAQSSHAFMYGEHANGMIIGSFRPIANATAS